MLKLGNGKNKTTKDSEKANREARAKKATKKATKTPAPASKKAATKTPVDNTAKVDAVFAKIKKAGKLAHRALPNSTEKKIARQLMRDGVIKREAIDGVLTYIAK